MNGLSAERCVACALEDLAPSPFYNMLFRVQPVDKALVLLHFTQRSKASNSANGCRIATPGAKDATNLQHTNAYFTIACCNVERSPEFSADKNLMAFAIVCKVVKPSDERHVAECYLEYMERINEQNHANVVATMQQLQRVTAAMSAEPTHVPGEAAWQQRKCRRLNRYPTVA